MSDLPAPFDVESLALVAARWWALRIEAPEPLAREFEAALWHVLSDRLRESARVEVEMDWSPCNNLLAAFELLAKVDPTVSLWREPWAARLPHKTRMVLRALAFVGTVRQGRGAPFEDLWCSLQASSPTWRTS